MRSTSYEVLGYLINWNWFRLLRRFSVRQPLNKALEGGHIILRFRLLESVLDQVLHFFRVPIQYLTNLLSNVGHVGLSDAPQSALDCHEVSWVV